ncbi:GNAT family N-acetyltransferase [Metaplanococcus flavidus]|uniref:GNAT family N-acetyltransferase n=1 Tax=Metaplanococcus flavidus TaxID=569883 RepID=A0ABW3LF37_9BACL
MEIKFVSPNAVREVSEYLEKMNRQNRSHIGFCGEQNEEIYDSLMNDFSDLKIEDSLVAAYEQDKLMGMIGLDFDLESGDADIWGPFVTDENLDVAQALWNKALLKMPQEIKTCSFFINKENSFAKKFIEKNNAKYSSADTVLNIKRGTFTSEAMITSKGISEEYRASFSNLHNETFPKTYFNSITILNRVNERNELLVLEEDETQIKGYVYIEANPEHGEGNIEYIAVSEGLRGQGVGKALLKDALMKLFSYPGIDEVTICVSCENTAAINLYKSVGFKEKYVLDSYDLPVNV